MKLQSLLWCLVPVAAVEVNLAIVLSLTGIDAGRRVLLPSFLTTLYTLFEEIQVFNANGPSVTYEMRREADPSLPENEFNCDNIVINPVFIDSMSDFGLCLTNLAAEREDTTIHAVMGARRSSVTIPLSYVTSTDKIPLLSPISTSPRLNDETAHKYFSRVVVSDNSVAEVYVQFLRDNNFRQAAMLYIEDDFGTGFKDAIFTQVQSDDSFDIEFISYAPEPTSIRAAINRAADTKLNIFLAISFDIDIPDMMLQAAARNLTGAGRFWVFGDGIRSGEDIISIVDDRTELTEDEVATIYEAVDETFLLGSVASVDSTSAAIRNLDSRHAVSLEDSETFDALKEIIPGGSRYLTNSDAEDQNPFTAQNLLSSDVDAPPEATYFSYDALYLFRSVLDEIFNVNNGEACSEDISLLDGDVFQSQISGDGFTFEGITGTIGFDGNSRSLATAAVEIAKISFTRNDDGSYRTNKERHALFENLVWDDQLTLVFKGGILPAITDPPENVEFNVVSSDLLIIMRLIAGAVLLAAFGIALWLVGYSHLPIVAAAQPGYLLSTLLGTAMLVTSVFFLDVSEPDYSDVENDFRCRMPYALISAGLTLIYASLLFKLRNIIKANDEKGGDYEAGRSYLSFPLVVSVNLFFLALVNLAAPLVFEEKVLETDEFGQAIETYGACVGEDTLTSVLYYLLFGFHILLYVFGLYLVLRARNLPNDFQDGFSVSISIFAQVQLSLLAVPVILSIGPEETEVFYLIICLVLLLFSTILLGFLFGPKMQRVLSGDVEAVWGSEKISVDLTGLDKSDELAMRENKSRRSSATILTDQF